MINVKIIKKPKVESIRSVGGIATGGNGYMPGATQREVEHAKRADSAKVADTAKTADVAATANTAKEADHATSSHTLDADSPVRDEFLSRLKSDVAAGLIRFLEGLVSVKPAALNGGATFGDFIEGMPYGRGGRVDAGGNAEFESLRVRSTLEVLELVINRLQAIEGDVVFTESDQIESVTLEHDVTIGDTVYPAIWRLQLRNKWEGYQTALRTGMVLRGVYNSMSRGGGDYLTSWLIVKNVGFSPATDERDSVNNVYALTYADADCPSGSNNPPVALMNLSRWGHISDRRYQDCFYLSSRDGRIVGLTEVTGPKIDASNFGSTLGTLPSFLKAAFPFIAYTDADGKERYEQGIYTKYLFAESIHHVDHLGDPQPLVRQTVRYAVTQSAAQPAADAFVYESLQGVAIKLGSYIWKRTETVYADGTKPTVSYDVSYVGFNGKDGDDGARGDRGPALRGPQLWGDVADGFAFESGADGESFIDVVMTSDNGQTNMYVCIMSHAKSTAARPGVANSPYWKPMSQIEFTATKILLAQYALVKNLGVESVDLRDADGNVIAWIHNGDVRFNKGTFSNVRVVAGGETEQRIELDPDTRSIRIYDNSGDECIVIDGTRQPREVLDGYELEITNPGSIAIDTSSNPTGVIVTREIMRQSVSEKSYVTVNIPTLTLIVDRLAPTGPSAVTGDTEVVAKLRFQQGSEVQVITLGQCLIQRDGATTSETVELEDIRASFDAAAGTEFTVTLVVESSFASGSVVMFNPTATYVFDHYQSRMFANGMTLMRTNRDYLTIYADHNGRIYLDRGSTAGSCHRFNGVTQPATLYAARVWADIDKAQPTVYAGKARVTRGPSTGSWYVTLPADPLTHTGNTLAWPVCNTAGATVSETARTMVDGALRFTLMTTKNGTPDWNVGFTIEIKLY